MYALIEYKPLPSPWNKGKIVGPKPPLRPQEVWSIRIHLQMKARGRDLALFNLAIDSKLRGYDLVLSASPHVSTRQYARIVTSWIKLIGLDPSIYRTHSMRRTKASLIYRRTKNLRAVQLLLGHASMDYDDFRTMLTEMLQSFADGLRDCVADPERSFALRDVIVRR